MLLTVTPNPSLDLLFTADGLIWDDANRVPMPRHRPGGQGVNLVRAARALAPRMKSLAVLTIGGRTGKDLAELLRGEDTPMVAVPIPHETRVFVGVRDRGAARALLLNPVGPPADAGVAEALFQAVLTELERPPDGSPRWLVCCGSLLPGLPADFYGRLGAAARARGWSFVPDCDGEALRLAAPLADLLVPNVHEAERLLGHTIAGPEQAAEAATALLERGAVMAVITMGADGAVVATRDGRWRAQVRTGARQPGFALELEEGSAVGAGDAFLAGLLVAGGTMRGARGGAAAPDDVLRAAVAAGTAALLSRGGDLLRLKDVERVLPHVAVEVVQG